jgi:hypothetical protein
VLLVGIIVTLLGTLVTGGVYWTRPVEPGPLQIDYERLQADTESLSLGRSFQLWGYLKADLRRESRPDERAYVEAMVWYRRWLRVALVVLGTGVVVIVASLLAPRVIPR